MFLYPPTDRASDPVSLTMLASECWAPWWPVGSGCGRALALVSWPLHGGWGGRSCRWGGRHAHPPSDGTDIDPEILDPAAGPDGLGQEHFLAARTSHAPI